MNIKELEIIYLPPAMLTPYAKNAKIHKREDIEAIKESILSVGFNDPIGIYGPDNIIVEGHGRWRAATELGLESVPCIRLDHMTDEQRRLYTLSHNRTSELSNWDFNLRDEELRSLSLDGFDIDKMGFEMPVIDWDNVEEIGAHNYEKPKSKKLRCPICGGVDEKLRFVEVS